ncbi:phage major capsid protein [Geobacillus stearothermophilus]|nr:phage major capsid protein [Geobacillus stearothermophilus]
MNKQEYLAKRKSLLEAAEKALNEGNLDEFEAKEKEIKDLDEKFEAFAKAQANINALKDKQPAAVAVEMAAGEDGVVATTRPVEAKDEKEVYLRAWAKDMMGLSLDGEEKVVFDKFNTNVQNAVQSTTQHAVLIPETVRDGIWREAQELFPILADLRMTFVPGDFTIIKETNSGADADWYDEATAVVDGDFAFEELNLSGCELAKSIPISWKLRKMSIDAFIPYIQTLLAEKIGAAIAKGVVSGLGKPGAGETFKPQPKGIVTAILAETGTPQLVEYDSTNVLNYDKLAMAMGKIKSAYKTGAAIYAKSTMIWDKLVTMKDSTGRPLFIPDLNNSNGVGRMFGLPVKEEDSVPEGAILIGNVGRGYALNINEDMTIYTEDHVKQRYTDYMAYALVDGAPLSTKAFAYIREKVTV